MLSCSLFYSAMQYRSGSLPLFSAWQLVVSWPGTQFGDSNTTSNITDFQCRTLMLGPSPFGNIFLHWKSVIFDIVLKLLKKPLFEGWPADYWTQLYRPWGLEGCPGPTGNWKLSVSGTYQCKSSKDLGFMHWCHQVFESLPKRYPTWFYNVYG